MKTWSVVTAAVVGLASFAEAHMEMKDPPPLRSKFNKFTTEADYSMTSPLSPGGSDFPCKGYNKPAVYGTPQGQSVVTWTPGQTYNMTITGGANHGGGSCQASLSYDGGSTWKVIHSFVGNCPTAGTSSYSFAVPSDAPTGKAIFAWTWFNLIGNREMYMNCAAVTIGGSSPKIRKARAAPEPFSSRPGLFVANVGNGCSTVEGSDLAFPQPGQDVTTTSNKVAGPAGSCPKQDSPPSGGAGAVVHSTTPSVPASAVPAVIQSSPVVDAPKVSTTASPIATPTGTTPEVGGGNGGNGGGGCQVHYVRRAPGTNGV